MSTAKTQPTDADIGAFLQAVTPERRRRDALHLDLLFRRVTGFDPVLWGSSMVGYGQYAYRYASGRSGRFLATGFSPRASAFSIYIMPGYTDFGPILDRLGKHKTGKACLYINKLSDVDEDALAELIRAGLTDLAKIWPVTPG